MASKRSDGRWVERFTFAGKRYVAYGKTKKEASSKARQKLADLENKKYVKSNELTLDQYHERWEKARYGTVKESTIRTQELHYKRVKDIEIDKAGTKFGSLKITEIEVQNVRDLQDAMKKKKRKNGSRMYSNQTINDSMNHIKHIMNDAIKERVITWNPFCSVKNLKREKAEARDTYHRALTVQETQTFLKEAESSWYYDAYRFMLCSGCRVGEVGAIKYSDINYKKGVIEIRRTLTKDELGNYVIGDSTKSKHGMRDIPLTPQLEEIIKHQKAKNQLLWGNTLQMDAMLFPDPEGGILRAYSISRNIGRIVKRAGIEHFTCHAFRDTFATRAIESGMNPKTLQEILGHADIKITMNLYCHCMDDTKAREMNNLIIAM